MIRNMTDLLNKWDQTVLYPFWTDPQLIGIARSNNSSHKDNCFFILYKIIYIITTFCIVCVTLALYDNYGTGNVPAYWSTMKSMKIHGIISHELKWSNF